MGYKRTTKDEYQLHVKYYGQWEEVTCEESLKEIRQRNKEYLENDTFLQDIKIVKKRVNPEDEVISDDEKEVDLSNIVISG